MPSDNALLQCLISYCSKQGHTFSAWDNKLPMALLSEKKSQTIHMNVMLWHQMWWFFFFIIFIFYALHRAGKATIRTAWIVSCGMFRGLAWGGASGVEGLWAQRVSEWQSNWPFSTLCWKLLIRGNYKGLLARNDLILLREWEPNVIMALWYPDLTSNGNKPRSQPERARLPTLAQFRANDQNILILGRDDGPPVSCIFLNPLTSGWSEINVGQCWEVDLISVSPSGCNSLLLHVSFNPKIYIWATLFSGDKSAVMLLIVWCWKI